MTKSTTLLALTLVAAAMLITVTPATQAATIPSKPAAQLEKRGTFFASFIPMLKALRPVTNDVGQGAQVEAARVEGAFQDAGGAIKKQADSIAAASEDVIAGGGRAIVRAPEDAGNVLAASPL
ncbi:hypothetical protein BGZ95_004652 [Linnemannia exigua]|uniref:Uncharacterized protein n=1 Tax=Linnemannia exigua TaxID=604196 RepID=A0AAD4H1P3_9FUNG|nr:hypothetical protein BGZ95_004652 [Linnemannia exigua]